ncbi:MAG: hypothetical protein L0H63_13635 [Nitrococcus sp.]|nr:hypothetical protein [Nitrococcus sp.]
MKTLLLTLLLTGCAASPVSEPVAISPAPVVIPQDVAISLPLAALRECVAERDAQARANRAQAAKTGKWKEYAAKLEALLGMGEE